MISLWPAREERSKDLSSRTIWSTARGRIFFADGPNQGGKTTFARSLGQLIYFAKMGLDVPAKVANVHYFSSLLTHFSVEESVETEKGKLKEILASHELCSEGLTGLRLRLDEEFTDAFEKNLGRILADMGFLQTRRSTIAM